MMKRVSLTEVIKPMGYDKHGPMFAREDVKQFAAQTINTQCYFIGWARMNKEDIDNATKLADEATEEFSAALDRFLAVEQRLGNEARAASGRVRDAVARIQDGMAKLAKAVDVNRLERHVELVERMAVALEKLSAMDEAGKLKKISEALK